MCIGIWTTTQHLIWTVRAVYQDTDKLKYHFIKIITHGMPRCYSFTMGAFVYLGQIHLLINSLQFFTFFFRKLSAENCSVLKISVCFLLPSQGQTQSSKFRWNKQLKKFCRLVYGRRSLLFPLIYRDVLQTIHSWDFFL